MKKGVLVLLLLQFCLITVASAETAYEFAIKPIYTAAASFSEYGLAKVSDANGKSGVINVKGDKVFGFDDTQFSLRKNGLIMAVGENGMAAFFNGNGKRITDYIYDVYSTVNHKNPREIRYNYLTNIYDGDGKSPLVPVSRDKKFGYINPEGIEVIPPTYDYVYGFYNGISRTGAKGNLSEYGTYTNGKFGYINEIGEVLYPADSLWAADDFINTFARIADGQYKIIDTSGRQLDFNIGEYLPYEEEYGLILAYADDKTAVFDYYNNTIVKGDWRRKELFNGSIIIDNKLLLAPNGKILYEAPEGVFISSQSADSQFRYITKNISDTPTVSGLINAKGEVVFPCEYSTIRDLGEGLVYAENYNGKNIIYNEYARELCTLNGQIRGNPSHNLLPVLDFDTMKYGYIKYPIKTEGKQSAEFLYNLGLF